MAKNGIFAKPMCNLDLKHNPDGSAGVIGGNDEQAIEFTLIEFSNYLHILINIVPSADHPDHPENITVRYDEDTNVWYSAGARKVCQNLTVRDVSRGRTVLSLEPVPEHDYTSLITIVGPEATFEGPFGPVAGFVVSEMKDEPPVLLSRQLMPNEMVFIHSLQIRLDLNLMIARVAQPEIGNGRVEVELLDGRFVSVKKVNLLPLYGEDKDDVKKCMSYHLGEVQIESPSQFILVSTSEDPQATSVHLNPFAISDEFMSLGLTISDVGQVVRLALLKDLFAIFPTDSTPHGMAVVALCSGITRCLGSQKTLVWRFKEMELDLIGRSRKAGYAQCLPMVDDKVLTYLGGDENSGFPSVILRLTAFRNAGLLDDRFATAAYWVVSAACHESLSIPVQTESGLFEVCCIGHQDYPDIGEITVWTCAKPGERSDGHDTSRMILTLLSAVALGTDGHRRGEVSNDIDKSSDHVEEVAEHMDNTLEAQGVVELGTVDIPIDSARTKQTECALQNMIPNLSSGR